MAIARVSARRCASNVIVSTGPDVCWTPVGSSKKAVAYSSVAFLDTAIRYSASVRNNGKYDFQLNSRASTSTGHEPGVLRGRTVPGYLGPAHVKVAAHYLFSEGWATCSHRDPGWINRPDPGPVEPQKAMRVAGTIIDVCVASGISRSTDSYGNRSYTAQYDCRNGQSIIRSGLGEAPGLILQPK